MIKWLEKTLGQEFKTPRDFLYLAVILCGLAFTAYAIGIALWFLLYIFGYHVVLTTLFNEFSKVLVGEIPFIDSYAWIWSTLVRDITNLDVIRSALGLFLLITAVLGHITIVFIIFMIFGGLIFGLWKLARNSFSKS